MLKLWGCNIIATTLAFSAQAQWWQYEFDGKFSGNSVESFQVGEAKFGDRINGDLTPLSSRLTSLSETLHKLGSECLNGNPATIKARNEMRKVGAAPPTWKTEELWHTAPILLSANTKDTHIANSNAMAIDDIIVSISFYKEYVTTSDNEILVNMDQKYGERIIHESETDNFQTVHYVAYGKHSPSSLKSLLDDGNRPFRFYPSTEVTSSRFYSFWDKIKNHPDIPETPLIYARINSDKETGKVQLRIAAFQNLKSQVTFFNEMVNDCAETRRKRYKKVTDEKIKTLGNEL